MSNNPFRQSREESFTNGFRYGNGYNGSNVDVTGTTGYDVGNSNNVEKSNGSALDASLGSSFDTEHQTHISTTKSDNGNGTIPAQYRDQVLLQDEAHHQNNGSGSQRFSNPFAVQPSNSAQYVTDEQSHPIALEPTIHSTLITSNGHEVDSLQELVQGVHLQHQAPEVVTQPRHAHVPSISQIRKESLANVRPTYVRALSSHIAESMAPSMTHGEAHAEAVRRLGKAEKTVKTIKRRGSNESLASLVSYSIRRPSISVTPKGNGYSLDALAYVLEEAAQEGNLELVQAVMALGANPNFRSVNRIKNRRHDALNKATAAGHVEVIDYLIRQGATYNLGDSAKKDAFEPIDYKLLDVAYSGYGEVARYLIANQGANPFAEQWPREYFDANRTVYRRVAPTRVYQRSVLDAIARMGSQEADTPLVNIIMRDPRFNPTAVASRVYIDQPYDGDGTRMSQVTCHYSALSTFIKAGWADTVEAMLDINPDPSAYQQSDTITSEEGQIPSTYIHRNVWPANALAKDTWLYHPATALRILNILIEKGFDVSTAQRTSTDSAPRTPMSRCILANAVSGVKTLIKSDPSLVHEDISFRLLLSSGTEQEYIAQPLAASIIQGSLDCARILLKYGASPSDPAFSYRNVLMFAAGHGVSGILPELIDMAPEMLGEALEIAISKYRVASVEVLLCEMTEGGGQGTSLWNAVLKCHVAGRDEDVKFRYMRIMDAVYEAGVEQRPSVEMVRKAVEMDNTVGVEKMLDWGFVRREEVGVLCRDMGKGGEWSDVLARYGRQ
jgi:hypothetical protein